MVGSQLWLPVWCDGGLYSCGDAHAVQGDGEICVSAVECAMEATLRFVVHDRSIPGPSYRVPGRVGPSGAYHGTMGIDADLMEGARTADLHIHEIVDAGVWNVGMTMPLAVFA